MKTLSTVVFFVISVFFVQNVYSHHLGEEEFPSYADLSSEDASNWFCKKADREPCPDLLHFDISYEKLSSYHFSKHCPSVAKACAVVSVKNKSCVVYSKRSSNTTNSTILHEVNHCYGWQHKTAYESSHDKPWKVFKALVPFVNKGAI